MNLPRFVAVFAGALALAPTARAESAQVMAVMPIYSQLLAFTLPAGFASGFESEADGSYLHEFVPAGETVDNWTQLLTVSGNQGLAQSGMTAAQVVDYYTGGYQNTCPDSLALMQPAAIEVPGAATASIGLIGCGDNGNGRSETMLILAMVGAADIYTLQWAEHGPAIATPPTLDQDLWRPRLEIMLSQTRICDPVAGETAPFPSCTQ